MGGYSATDAGAGLRWSIERRLEFIEFRLYWEGQVNRSDIVERFGVSINQASADLSRYQALAPDALAYDRSAKCYRTAPSFAPRLLEPDAGRYLAQLRLLADGIVGLGETWLAAVPSHDAVLTPRRTVAAPMLRAVLGAIRDRQALYLSYQSMSSPQPAWRWIEPHALAFDGFRWHARSFCRRAETFKDFVLARIAAVGDSQPARAAPTDDRAWQERITLEIAPHPGLSPGQAAAIARDYGMTDGRLAVPVRRAFLYYVLRRLGLDIDPDHRRPQDQHIVLVNREAVQRHAEAAQD